LAQLGEALLFLAAIKPLGLWVTLPSNSLEDTRLSERIDNAGVA